MDISNYIPQTWREYFIWFVAGVLGNREYLTGLIRKKLTKAETRKTNAEAEFDEIKADIERGDLAVRDLARIIQITRKAERRLQERDHWKRKFEECHDALMLERARNDLNEQQLHDAHISVEKRLLLESGPTTETE